MTWDMDVPNLYFKKPKQVTELEELSRTQREAMDFVEIEERVQNAAESIAEGYKKDNAKADYDGCVEVVMSALKETGSSLGGKMGTRMVGISEPSARNACRIYFPNGEEQ